jgi:hypothetical protein
MGVLRGGLVERKRRIHVEGGIAHLHDIVASIYAFFDASNTFFSDFEKLIQSESIANPLDNDWRQASSQLTTNSMSYTHKHGAANFAIQS